MHKSRRNRLVNFCEQFFYRANAYLFATVVGAPNWQRRAPIARAREVPVVQIFEPLAKTPRASRFGFPVDGFVQRNHLVFHGGGFDKPTIERIVNHWFVGAPAVRIVVQMFLDTERQPLLFQHQAERNVERFVLVGEVGVVGVFHKSASKLFVQIDIYLSFHEIGVQIVQQEEFARHIDHGACFAVFGSESQCWHARFFGHKSVVGTKGGRNMHNTCAVVGGNIVARDEAECALAGIRPRNKLFVLGADQIGAFAAPQHFGLFAQLLGVGSQTRFG